MSLEKSWVRFVQVLWIEWHGVEILIEIVGTTVQYPKLWKIGILSKPFANIKDYSKCPSRLVLLQPSHSKSVQHRQFHPKSHTCIGRASPPNAYMIRPRRHWKTVHVQMTSKNSIKWDHVMRHNWKVFRLSQQLQHLKWHRTKTFAHMKLQYTLKKHAVATSGETLGQVHNSRCPNDGNIYVRTGLVQWNNRLGCHTAT